VSKDRLALSAKSMAEVTPPTIKPTCSPCSPIRNNPSAYAEKYRSRNLKERRKLAESQRHDGTRSSVKNVGGLQQQELTAIRPSVPARMGKICGLPGALLASCVRV